LWGLKRATGLISNCCRSFGGLTLSHCGEKRSEYSGWRHTRETEGNSSQSVA